MDTVETVKIKSPVSKENDQGFIVINKDDFVKDEHELFVEPKAKPAKNADKPAE